MDLNPELRQLLKKLVEHWGLWDEYEAYYLETLAPKLVANPNSGCEFEVPLLHAIRKILDPEDWQNLPVLIRTYRVEAYRQKECEREAVLRAQEERQKEARRRAEERKQEELRREVERNEKERRVEEEHQERVRRKAEKQILFRNLKEHFERDFLNAYDFYQAQCSAHMSFEEYETEKTHYVRSWVKYHLASNPNLEHPDPEQLAAIGAVEGHVQVVARAGSGKTDTLINRSLFLQQHCGVSPDEMLLLAFNRKAAEEMRQRLASQLVRTQKFSEKAKAPPPLIRK